MRAWLEEPHTLVVAREHGCGMRLARSHLCALGMSLILAHCVEGLVIGMGMREEERTVQHCHDLISTSCAI